MDKKAYNKDYYANNREKIRLQQQTYQQKNYQKISTRKKRVYKENPEPIKKSTKLYYKENRDHLLEKAKEYQRENKQSIKQRKMNYYNENKSIIKYKNKEYINKRLKIDPIFRLLQSLRTRTRNAILSNDNKKYRKTLELIGCDLDFIKKYIESQFKEGMSWDNHGLKGWHIDHIIPCSSFDLSDPEHQLQCFHYTNLQPLWWWENLEKGSKILEK
jgi:hypothetical protein